MTGAAKRKAKGQGASAPGPAPASRRKVQRASPFMVRDGLLCREIVSEGEDGESRKSVVPFGSELNILARTRSAEGEDHGRLLEVVDPDGVRHQWAMPAALLAGSGEGIRTELLRLGLGTGARRGKKMARLAAGISAFGRPGGTGAMRDRNRLARPGLRAAR